MKSRIFTWMAKKFGFIFAACFIISYSLFQLSVLSKNSSPFEIQTQNWKKHKEYVRKTQIEDFSSQLDDWTEVPGHNRKVFLYSAFHDTRQTVHVVRIISILEKSVKAINCYIQTESGVTKEVVGEVRHIHEHFNLKYICSFITCPYSHDAPEDAPAKVTVGIKGIDTDQKLFINVETMDKRKEEGYMSVCVKPFHYEFNRAVWLVEFVEMYLLMGAEHFIFYNHTVGPDVQKVLDHYITRGIATVLPWDLPVKSQNEIRTEGLFAALNDCNLRSVNRFPYTAFVDVDEFIIPRRHDNFPDLLESLGPHDEYIFKNVFFYLYWDNDTRVDQFLYSDSNSLGSRYFGTKKQGPYLLTQYKTTRLNEPHPTKKRSKYITKPTKAIECGNHFVWNFADGKKNTVSVRSSEALSHHYRICEFGGFDCLDIPHQIDNTAHRWMDSLVMNIGERCKSMFSEEGTCPEAPPLGSPW